MRNLIVAGILFCASLWGCTPREAAAKTTSDVKLAQVGDSLQVSVYYTLRGADSAKYTVSSTNGKPAVSQTGRGVGGRLIFTILGPAEGETDTVTVKPVAYKAGVAFPQSDIIKVHKRDVTAPPVVTDSVTLSQALIDARFAQSLTIQNTDFSCDAQWLDFRRELLIGAKGIQTPACQEIFDTTVRAYNLQKLNAMAAGYPWTATQDSIWRANPPAYGSGV